MAKSTAVGRKSDKALEKIVLSSLSKVVFEVNGNFVFGGDECQLQFFIAETNGGGIGVFEAPYDGKSKKTAIVVRQTVEECKIWIIAKCWNTAIWRANKYFKS